MIDNIELIKPLLTFESKDDFYYLQILQRKKENPQLGSNSRVIKNYYITSIEYLEERYEEIKMLCNNFNARASIRLNKRSFTKVAFKTIQNVANSMANKDFFSVRKSYDRACGVGHNDKNKTWILDWDGKFDEIDKFKLMHDIDNCPPLITGDKCKCYIPSKSGMHIIVQPFDSREFVKHYSDVEIHKDNPTNLYIP